MPKPIRSAAYGALLLLAACAPQTEAEKLSELDNQIAADDSDPALTSALGDQITVDPALTQQSNSRAVRPAPAPVQAQYPRPAQVRRGNSLADRQAEARVRVAEGGGADCSAGLDTNPRWVARLPAAFGMYPGGRLTEAAGNDAGECAMRVVTFRTAAPAGRVLTWYNGRARGAGYSAEHQRREGDHILAGTDAGDGAYYLIVTPLPSGSDVALIVDEGR